MISLLCGVKKKTKGNSIPANSHDDFDDLQSGYKSFLNSEEPESRY
jgi:hypothetical protein